MQLGPRRRISAPGRWRDQRVVATIFIAGAVVLSGCDTAPDVAGVDPASPTGQTETTIAPEPTAPPTTAVGSSDPATLATDRLFEVFNAEDAEGVAGVFGDDVAFTLESGEEVVGADAAAFWQGYIGRETAERLTDAFHASDGRTYFLAEFTFRPGVSSTFVFDVEMDGERLVRMGARPRNLVEVTATSEIDNLYEAFNDQDLDRLTDEFEGMTYTSPSGVSFAGAEAAEHWAEAFGSVVTRATGVFALDGGAAGFVTEHKEPQSDHSTAYAVEVEVSGGRITRMTEHPVES
jgi:hypothetical protein